MILENRTYKAVDLIRLAFKVAPGWALLTCVLRLLSALFPAALVVVTANFIDTSLAVLEGAAATNDMHLPILLLGMLASFRWFVNVIHQFIRSQFLMAMRLTYRVELIEKRARLQYRYIEDQETYDLIKRITDPADTQLIDHYHNVLGLMDIILQVFSFLGILLVHVWWAVIFIICLSIPTAYFGAKAGKTIYDAERTVSKVARKAWYLADVCSGRDAALERTLYGYGPPITKELWDHFEHVRIHNQTARRKMEMQITASGMLVSLTVGAVMLILLLPVATGVLSIGLFMSLVTACMTLSTVLSERLPGHLYQLTMHMSYLKELGQFCQLEETEGVLKERCSKGFNFKKLEFKHVSFTYPGTQKLILNDVNLTIIPGKHYAFVGENGAGKSTLMKVMFDILKPTSGEITILDTKIGSGNHSVFEKMSGIIESPNFYQKLTVYENLEIHCDYTGKAYKKDIGKVLQLVGLEDKVKDKKVRDLSMGMKQRLAFGRAILCQPEVLILDEPINGLDPKGVVDIRRLLLMLKEQGMTILISSHLIAELEKIVDRIGIIHSGVFVEELTMEQIRNDQIDLEAYFINILSGGLMS